jgi:hypothetical protein
MTGFVPQVMAVELQRVEGVQEHLARAEAICFAI